MTSMRREGSAATMDDVKAWIRTHGAAHISSFRLESNQSM
jgi:hypothetical protein